MQAGAFQGVDGDDLGVGECGGPVGAGGDRAQVVGGDVVDEERDDAGGHGRIAVLTQDDTQLVQIGLRQRRVFLGQVEAAVGSEAFQEDVAEGTGGRVGAASGRNVAHGSILSERGRGLRGRPFLVTCMDEAGVTDEGLIAFTPTSS